MPNIVRPHCGDDNKSTADVAKEEIEGHHLAMGDTPWTPDLVLDTRNGRCHLRLCGVTYGNGPTLQEASNDLMARVFDLAMGLRQAGLRMTPGVDTRVPGFLWEISELALCGGDLRARVFGGG